MRIVRLALTAALGAGLAPAVAAQTAAQDVAMGIAARAAPSLDPRAALRHFQAALALDSMNFHANWEGALSLIDIGSETPDSVPSAARDSMYALAEVYARRAVKAEPDSADGHFALANAIGRASLTKSNKERVRRAVEIRNEALEAIRLNPGQDGAYHVLGRWNAEIMRLSGVTRFFAKTFLGAKIFNEASWEGATSNLEHAVELDPRRIFHRLDLARVYVDLGRFTDARTQLQRIATLPLGDPGDARYKREAADLLRQIADKKDKS